MTARARLDAVAPFLVCACVLAAAAGSSIQRQLFDAGRPARWLFLALFIAFALARASLDRRSLHFPELPAAALAAFVGLALVSTAWSVNAHGTAERAIVQAAVIAAVGSLVATRDLRLMRGLVDGVVAAAAIVAVAGFVYWLVSPSHAVIHATTDYGTRFQGIEENPNTAPALYAIALPLAFGRALLTRGRARVVLVAAVLVVALSVAAGSRGGLLAAYTGALAVCALAPFASRRRAALALAVVVAFAASTWALTLPKPLPGHPVSVPATTKLSSRDAEATLPLAQEIGNPWWTRRSGDSHRSLLATSVRLRALRGSVRLALERPLLGFGFGAEQWAFFNRYYAFASGNPENGYVGIFLQTGIVGLVLFLVALGACAVAGLTGWLRRRASAVTLAAFGGTAGALVLGVSQSYFHGVGSISYLALWISLLVCAASATEKERT
ncbi:MAG: O-antigen ligase family protein [Gaiellaceae bacterium]